jgi:hypothetical protein
MMRLGHCTARRALTQAMYTIRATQSIGIGTFSTCSVHRHATPPVRQEHAQQSPPSTYQSYRPDPKRQPVIPTQPMTLILETRKHPRYRRKDTPLNRNGTRNVRCPRTILPSSLHNNVPL